MLKMNFKKKKTHMFPVNVITFKSFFHVQFLYKYFLFSDYIVIYD